MVFRLIERRALRQSICMRLISSVGAMQRQALSWRRASTRVGFVPTMGYLHAGHVSLMRRARAAVKPEGVVVVSIYVNPIQFGPNEDLTKYPRDLEHDKRLCREAGVDVLFAPADSEIYPPSENVAFSTYVIEGQLSREMEGVSRPNHFRGVTFQMWQDSTSIRWHSRDLLWNTCQEVCTIGRMRT